MVNIGHMSKFYMNTDFSDVEFILGNETLPAHRLILAQSEHFRRHLDSGLDEPHQRKIVVEEPVRIFKLLLQYIYTGEMQLAELSKEEIVEALRLVHKYGFAVDHIHTPNYLSSIINVDNVCAILNITDSNEWNNFTKTCLEFMKTRPTEVLQHESFKSLSQKALRKVVHENRYIVPEIDIFSAILMWHKSNTDCDIKSLQSLVSPTLIDCNDLLNIVKPSRMFEPNQMQDILKTRGMNPSTKINKSGFICGTIEEYETFFSSSWTPEDVIRESEGRSMKVELATTCFINNIKLLVNDARRCFSYFIDVSENGIEWQRILDYIAHYCYQNQDLYFKGRNVRYIKLVGVHRDSPNKIMNVEVAHIAPIPASIQSKSFNKLDISLKSEGDIQIVQYPLYSFDNRTLTICQPIIVHSAIISLESDDHKIKVEISKNEENWVEVKSTNRSGSVFLFPGHLISFIRLTIPGYSIALRGAKIRINTLSSTTSILV